MVEFCHGGNVLGNHDDIIILSIIDFFLLQNIVQHFLEFVYANNNNKS